MKTVRALQLNFYEHKAFQHNRAMDIYHQYRIFASDNGTDWILVVDKSDSDKDCPHDYIELAEPLQTRYLKFEACMCLRVMWLCRNCACSAMPEAMPRKR